MAPPLILLVEDEENLAEATTDLLEIEGYRVVRVDRLRKAKDKAEHLDFDLILLDLKLPDGSGLDFLPMFQGLAPAPVVLVLTADVSLESAVEAIRRGAHDYLTKPFDSRALIIRIENALKHRRVLASNDLHTRLRGLEENASTIISLPSPKMKALYQRLKKVASHASIPMLITGETGVGKEHVSRMIHDVSPRSLEPFIAINCATLDRTFLRSELFGHEKGAFTGANTRRQGLLELAKRGTVLLDEIGEMSPEVQPALLRVIETGCFRRLGGTTEYHTNVRFLGATNKSLERMVDQGSFRRDLYFRLNAMELHVPPLRERPEDIRVMGEHFCDRIGQTIDVDARMSEDAFQRLFAYPWPGNIRELRHVIERAVLLSTDGRIDAESLELKIPRAASTTTEFENFRNREFPSLAKLERLHIQRALQICGQNRTRAARMLGVARSTLTRKLQLSDLHLESS